MQIQPSAWIPVRAKCFWYSTPSDQVDQSAVRQLGKAIAIFSKQRWDRTAPLLTEACGEVEARDLLKMKKAEAVAAAAAKLNGKRWCRSRCGQLLPQRTRKTKPTTLLPIPNDWRVPLAPSLNRAD